MFLEGKVLESFEILDLKWCLFVASYIIADRYVFIFYHCGCDILFELEEIGQFGKSRLEMVQLGSVRARLDVRKGQVWV